MINIIGYSIPLICPHNPLFHLTIGSHYDSDLSIVFEPALGETVSIDTKSSSLVLSAASNNSLYLTA
jgi:hypothetical protein